MSVDMASSLPKDGIRRVSISPTDTEPESDDMEPCADPLPMEIDERPGVLGSYEVRFPAETPVTPPAIGLSHALWCKKIMNESLPGDGFGRECFDTLPQFVVGDPSARFETHTPLTYETNGETGQPLWTEIFSHILKECAYLTAFHTVYVMVDTRNLKAHETAQDGLPHWPAAVAWWHSRVQLVGPQQEKTELLYFPATEETGLHRVHPTWAGTFVLAALVAIFPGINFILLDSDCLPITLFEAADLWKEGFLARFPLGAGKGLPQKHPLHRRRDYVNRPDVVYTQHRVNADRQGQGVLLVTEPHSELNAGLVVVFSSAHPSIFNWSEWTRRCRCLPDTEYNSLLSSASENVVQEFLKLLTGFLHRTLSSNDLTPQEKQQWVQSGLALSPLVATCTQYSVDFCLAWALIGEWTSRILFPVPKGPWPRHGHAGALLRRYQARSPRMVAWARATFEQGALPSLLFLQGLVPIFTLPGDKMFQATGLCSHKQRPPIMHAYGGAKSGMAQALQSIASEGWIPLAAAMVGTSDKPPLWADLGLRPVVGTTLDKLGPRPLEHRDVALLLSCWNRWDFTSVADSAINMWLKGANPAFGPDCEDSPCYRIRNMNVLDVMRLFGECGFEFLPETDLQKRPGLGVVMTVGLHLCALEMTDQQVDTLACIALAGQLPEFFPLQQWICAVKKSFLSQEVVTCAKPGPQQIRGCCTSFTYITNEIASYKGHFGPDEHDYSHWMALDLPHGSYALRVLLFIRPEAASKARRDATPLRLISWLSYKLNPELEQFIEQAMEHLSTWTETEGGKVLTMGKEAIPQGETINSEVELRDRLIDLISVGNLKHKPKALFTLFRQFLTRISLPRLIHFMDLVLPQLTPVQAAWREKKRLCGAVTTSGGCESGSLMPPHGCKSRISSPPMTTSTMYGFNGIAIPSFCSLIQ